MKALTFKGGIHPHDNKHHTEKMSIISLQAPDRLYFPMQQHIGAPCEPVVAVGDEVKVGQKIADSKAFVSAPIHSSVSGKVVAIESILHPNGSKVMAIVVENDDKDTVDESVVPKGELDALEPKQIISIVREAGIVGMGGAGFPTHVKLSPPPDKKIDYVIINGAECEPYLTSDHRVMLEAPGEVILGLKAIMKVFGLNKGYIGIEENKMDAIKTMKEHASKEAGIEVVVLKTKYPQGAEKQLIKVIAGREVPSGALPADVGAVVNNIDTCTAIARAITTGMPLTRRIVTVSGAAVKEPRNYAVKIGTPFKYLFEQSGGFIEDPAKIVMGGPMMGIAQFSIDVPVVKGTSGLLAFTKEDVQLKPESPCIRCGKCVGACPMNLLPIYLSAYSSKNDLDKAEEYNAADCIECGSCSYVCPSKRHLVQSIRGAKQAIIAKKRAQAAK
ncbi:electron transport complex subunit RsxC [Petroclostridium sp. X23]|uniref:electron transport complex subunit RsxC n=1 Tax=Petroclostridium sp. X23 TaxID=3045146 RepID=UPI0024AD374C|nr:electron transport complex subunit RsxC [Petroclostridium sp. X23]WHH61044.1 electron transport complex subunit RsxC [Petroclostridium sp. X23]